MANQTFLIGDNFNEGNVLVYEITKTGKHTHHGEQILIKCKWNIKPKTITYQQLYLTCCTGSIEKANKIISEICIK